MKKTNKVLAVLLAVTMIFSCFGMVFANAMTEDAATAAAEEWNANKADYSKVYKKIDIPEVALKAIMMAADPIVSALLKQVDIEKMIYTDEVATEIVKVLDNLYPNNIPWQPKLNDFAKAKFPDAYEFFAERDAIDDGDSKTKEVGITDWTAVGTIPFGIVPGDKEAFVDAIALSTQNFTALYSNAVKIIAGMMKFPAVYDDAILELVDSLKGEPMPSMDEMKKVIEIDKDNISTDGTFWGECRGYYFGHMLLDCIIPAIDKIIAAPVSTLTDILPGVITAWGDFKVNTEAGLAKFGMKIPVPTLDSIINDALAGANLPAIDLDMIAGMATAKVTESGKNGGYAVTFNGDKTAVFAYILGYASDLLGGGKNDTIDLTKLGEVLIKLGVNADLYAKFAQAIEEDEIESAVIFALQMATDYLANNGADVPDGDPASGSFIVIVYRILNLIMNILEYVFENFID